MLRAPVWPLDVAFSPTTRAMASKDNTDSQGEDTDLAKAFQEIAQGERQASAIENNLTSLEKKLDELLARANEDQKNIQSLANNSKVGSQGDSANTKEATSKDVAEK
ncbi:hypothetical protein EV356DRAFT_528487 [Viridothelium virens]|uniref:Uncharacterized protein n=1 Tax=Viridothelium virens TaxID=1048519 RepID=A0A6A6HP06_VIRVR|nr:hypothetical protein EV356DRAFT_528487 [Viridothelium virens]